MIDEETVKSIEALHRLKEQGIISEEEFEKSKQRALFGGGLRAPSFTTAGPVTLPATDDWIGWGTLPLRRYADFTGRSCRREFWVFEIVPAVLTLLLFYVLGSGDEYDGLGAVNGMAAGLLILGLAGLLVPTIAVQVRRLHDQNRTGWLALLNLIPYVGAVIVLVLMLLEGTKGENQYGPDPLAT
jgi:uncharacterized membrane protein YhaH (DUF805 family)